MNWNLYSLLCAANTALCGGLIGVDGCDMFLWVIAGTATTGRREMLPGQGGFINIMDHLRELKKQWQSCKLLLCFSIESINLQQVQQEIMKSE